MKLNADVMSRCGIVFFISAFKSVMFIVSNISDLTVDEVIKGYKGYIS